MREGIKRSHHIGRKNPILERRPLGRPVSTGTYQNFSESAGKFLRFNKAITKYTSS